MKRETSVTRFTQSSGAEQHEGPKEWFPRRRGLRGIGYEGFHSCQVGSEQLLLSCPTHPLPVRTVGSLDLHCSLVVGTDTWSPWLELDGNPAVSSHCFHLAPGLREAEIGE